MKHSAVMRQGRVCFDDPEVARASLKEGTSVTVEPLRKARTLDQNKYLWAINRHWAAIFNSALPEGELPFTEEDAHLYWTEKLLGRPVDVPGVGIVLRRGRTSTQDTRELSHYTDALRDEAAARGHYIPSAEEWLDEQREKMR